MAKVVGVRFREVGKIYYFDSNSLSLKLGDKVVAETIRGIECGEVAVAPKFIDGKKLDSPPKKIIRKATKEDISKVKELKKKEKDAFYICEKKAAAHNLKMKIIDVQYTLDKSKLLFYFTADGRVDFRNLVKDLAATFKTRIELRQIGIRDEARILGGMGICGRQFCCATFLNDFQPVSIKMAKEQGLSLSPTKISGSCGRLLCCLKYEQDAYTDILKKTPKIGAIVNTPSGRGTVIDQNILTKTLVVKLDKAPDAAPAKFKVKEVSIIKDAKIKIDKDVMEELKDLE